MQTKAIVFVLLAFSPVPLFPMLSWVWPSNSEPFLADVASACCNEYHTLADYLYQHLDKTPPPPRKAPTPIHQWIQNNALQDGNIVSLYFFVRNYLELTPKPYFPQMTGYIYANDILLEGQEAIDAEEDFKVKCKIKKLANLRLCLTAILLCLQRVAYDAIFYYRFIDKNPAVFNAYAILKQKFHYLLTYIPNFEEILDSKRLSALSFENICEASINHRQENAWHTKKYKCNWVNGFGWAHAWTPGSKGIWFGPPVVSRGSPLEFMHFPAKKEEQWILEIVLNLFANINLDVRRPEIPITFNGAKFSSWKQFFQSYDFPISLDDIDLKTLGRLLTNS